MLRKGDIKKKSYQQQLTNNHQSCLSRSETLIKLHQDMETCGLSCRELFGTTQQKMHVPVIERDTSRALPRDCQQISLTMIRERNLDINLHIRFSLTSLLHHEVLKSVQLPNWLVKNCVSHMCDYSDKVSNVNVTISLAPFRLNLLFLKIFKWFLFYLCLLSNQMPRFHIIFWLVDVVQFVTNRKREVVISFFWFFFFCFVLLAAFRK